jgi:hypothetical protein
MSIAQISPAVTQSSPPQSVAESKAAPSQVAQDAQKTVQAIKTDTVTISPQAVQLASDGDTAAAEFKESAAEKATEALKNRK